MIHRALLCVGLMLAMPAMAAASSKAYYNQTYGYFIAIPDRLTIRTDPPPAPQHGFAIALGGHREISVDASYDAALLGSVEAAMQDRAADDDISAKNIAPVRVMLKGLPAERLQGQVGGRQIDLVVGYRVHGDEAIIYTLELDTDAAHRRGDAAMFRRILDGFALRALPD